MGDGIVDGVGAAAGKRVLELLGGLAKLLLEPGDTACHLVWTALELRCGGIEHACALLKIRDGALARYRFDAADIGARRRLGNDLEETDLCRVCSMGTTAELARERALLGADRNHADNVAVLLAEKRHGTGGLGLVDSHHTGHNGLSSEDLVVHEALDLRKLLGRQCLEVREVKAQVLGSNERSCLVHMVAKHVLKGSVEQVRRGVVAAQERAAMMVDRGVHDGAFRKLPLLDDRAVSIQAVVSLGVTNGKAHALGRQRARIAHLSAHLGIERGAIEHDLDLLANAGMSYALAVNDKRKHLSALKLFILVSSELSCGNGI